MRIAITGVSGYLGGLLRQKLCEESSVQLVKGIDIKTPEFVHEKFRFINCDIRDPALLDCLDNIDTVVHLAFIVQEIRDKKLTYDINVNGTKNLLNACAKRGVKKIVVASSVAAYGSVKRNEIITEETPLNGNENSYYSSTKKLVEFMLDEFEKKYPEIIVTRLRPSIFCGKNINNFFKDIVNAPVIFYIRKNGELPVVYEQDVADAFLKVIIENHPGAYNIHTGNLSAKKMAGILGKRALGVPFWLAKLLTDFTFRLGLSPVSSHWIVLARYPLRISNEKAKRVLGWSPAKSPEDAFKEMIQFLKKGE